ncbi:hypothetical protein HPS57_02265 [Prevotella sp. PINT]|jgi:hypothetical protein|uniref:hypothetical protein n=1 Tax=Palleniella intestinalis TaxID=2736291 RepID=UPI001554A45F|nr:hypothetical protein [Palleniella intestinalis]NPD80803.1 hypothetical protein [Palleniella intestinalis]
MKGNIYIKKKYDDENVVIYIHFQGENAVRQIEVYPDNIIKLSEELPICGDTFLYDQDFSDIVWDSEDFITEKEFNKIWNKNNG